jgi:hypothetical protein
VAALKKEPTEGLHYVSFPSPLGERVGVTGAEGQKTEDIAGQALRVWDFICGEVKTDTII